MTSKQVNRYALISFIVGVISIVIAVLVMYFFPDIELGRPLNVIVEAMLALPWIALIFFLVVSLVRGY
ncbi:hypothetical protein [Facilibium subflavum]|uniref:hypothetical protein n=1 Tax=Facilibium subflavum TaxID=2219058 RepID=UPI000E64E779|nr:hypothetical protein [Facilibium subflavum]